MFKKMKNLGLPATALLVFVAASPAKAADMTAREMADAVKNGSISAVEIVEKSIAAAEANKSLNAMITVNAAGAMAAAKATDAGVKDKPLAGVPIVVKDNIASKGVQSTGGTDALRGWIPAQDAPVLERLLNAGAILVGKTNLHELAFGITSKNAAFGAVGNPWAPDRFAGGSSGGTGAAIAAGIVPAGLGTDTGGSTRIPAAVNGIAGFRPSSGRYPSGGILPISSTRDTAGPMAGTVADLVLLDGVITGTGTALQPADISTIRLGRLNVANADIDAGTKAVMDQAYAKLEAAGATIVDVEMPQLMELSNKVGFPLALFEAKRELIRFLEENKTGITIEQLAKGIKSPDVQFVFNELILGDKAVPEVAYLDALNTQRPLLQAHYAETFSSNKLDALVFPTTPLPAQPIEGTDMNVMLNGKEVPTFQTFIRNTDPGSNAGVPGLSIPAGLTESGLPVGLEIDGPVISDKHLLAVGLAIENVLGPIGKPPAKN